MSAFAFEYKQTRLEGVKFVWHAQPTRILGGEAVEAVELTGPLSLEVDLLVLAIGQATKPACRRRFSLTRPHPIDRTTGQTSYPKLFAGGDDQRRPRSSRRSRRRQTRWQGMAAGWGLPMPKPTLATTFSEFPASIPSGWPPLRPLRGSIMRAFEPAGAALSGKPSASPSPT